jgi:PAS domain S-box-containing protein
LAQPWQSIGEYTWRMPLNRGAATVLVVDDTEAQRYVLARVLRKAGFQVEEARTGKQALELGQQKPDLILLDVHLPDMSGYDVYSHLKASPATDCIPVIFTSQILVDDKERVRVLQLGADDCFAQPVHVNELIAKADTLIRLRRAQAGVESLLHAVIETIPDAIYAKDSQSRLVLLNAAALKVVGKPGDQIFGHDDREFYDDPAVGAAILENDARVMATGVVEVFEEKLLTPQGYRYFLDTKAPWRDAKGQIIGIIGLSRDITERKQTDARVAADLAALTRMHELSEKLFDKQGPQPLLQGIMDAAVAIMVADRGTLQVVQEDSLRIVAQCGHDQQFLDFFTSAETRASAYCEAMLRRERVVIPDVEESPLFLGTPSLVALRQAGVRAIQSTPLVSRTGTLLGIITTQWGIPHYPDEHDLWRIDLLARQAADMIEYAGIRDALRINEERFPSRPKTAKAGEGKP